MFWCFWTIHLPYSSLTLSFSFLVGVTFTLSLNTFPYLPTRSQAHRRINSVPFDTWRGLSISRLWLFWGMGKLNKDLDKMHRISKQSIDLLKVEYTLTDESRPEWRSKLKALILHQGCNLRSKLGLRWGGGSWREMKRVSLLWSTALIDRRIFYNLFLTDMLPSVMRFVRITCMRCSPYIRSFMLGRGVSKGHLRTGSPVLGACVSSRSFPSVPQTFSFIMM